VVMAASCHRPAAPRWDVHPRHPPPL